MKTKMIILSLLVIAVVTAMTNTYGQQAGMRQAKEIMEGIKNTSEVSYNYTLNIRYPNGQKLRVSGSTYVNNKEKLLLNDNDAFTMFYTGHWFYKADHKARTVSIVDLDKEMDANNKKSIEKDLFENRVVMEFIDSILMKYGTLQSYERQQDSIKIEITFPIELIRGISLVYDAKNKELARYQLSTFMPTDETDNGLEGISQTMMCSGFKKGSAGKQYRLDSYFTIDHGNVVLKKYVKYRITN